MEFACIEWRHTVSLIIGRVRSTLRQGLVTCVVVKNRLGTSRKTRWQGERRQTRGVSSLIMSLQLDYVHSQSSFVTQRHETTNLQVFWRIGENKVQQLFRISISELNTSICSIFSRGNFSVISTDTLNRSRQFRSGSQIHLLIGVVLAFAVARI